MDASRIQVVDYLDDDNNKVGKIIKNLKLSRTQEYNRSSANGVYTQSITTDIVVGDPDFSVLFDSMEMMIQTFSSMQWLQIWELR